MHELGDGWEVYLKGRGKPRLSMSEPMVSIGKESKIAMNALAKDLLGDWVVLFFNSATRQIGLKPVERGTRDALCVRAQPAPSRLWRISVMGFFRAFNLDPNKTAGHYEIRSTDWGFVIQLPADSFREDDGTAK